MTPREQLTDWVKLQHQGRLIKRTTEPYFNHVLFVAETVEKSDPLGYEIGICHDLLEDTEVKIETLRNALRSFKYREADAAYIANGVLELTDVFTKSAYPRLKKTDRKKKEAERLAAISPVAQTVKYADLMYNVNWMLKYKRNKAVKYLQKKRGLLTTIDKGDHSLQLKVLTLINRALKEFGID